jgi:hypothetical protein
MSDMLKVALNCAQKGWFVFPLEAGKKTPDLSLVPHWSEDSSKDLKQIEEWWTKKPNDNIGIDLGRSNLTVLDFDSGDAPPNIGLPETFAVKTDRGQHWYYSGLAAQGDMHFGGKHVGEVKSAGGYVVGPKSLHPSGATYSVLSRASVANTPHELVVKLKARGPEPKDPVSVEGGPIPYGQHYKTLLAIAGKLRHDGLHQEEIEPVLVRVCETRCENPGADYPEMCSKLAREMGKKPIGQIGPTVMIGGVLPGQTTSGPAAPPESNVENWRDYFRAVGELEDGDVRMIINGFLPEGINALGALSSHGKTLFALSMAKSLTTGEAFLGRFQPEDIIPCLFLTPESSNRAFKMRCRAFGIPDDQELFLCRTVTEGSTLLLDDPILKKAVEKLKPVVFLDTMVRFNQSKDENDAASNQKLAKDIISLRAAGAVSVIILHHSTKASANEEMTLENCLRGTGDTAALCDSVYAIRRDRILYADGAGPNEIEVKCVKPRDFVPPVPFKIASTYKRADGTIVSYIDESGDFHLLELAAVQQEIDSKFCKLVIEDPSISRADLAAELVVNERDIRKLAKRMGWSKRPAVCGRWRV